MLKRPNILKYRLPALLFCFCAIFAPGQQLQPLEDPSQFRDRLKEASRQTSSIISDFTEEKHGSYLKTPVKSSGQFYYKRKDKIRWEKSSPVKYVFLADGNKVRIQDSGKELNTSSSQATVNKIRDLILNIVNGDFESGKLFSNQYFSTDSSFVVRLNPKNKTLKNMYEYLLLSFSRETMLLREIRFFEQSGDNTIMSFHNSKTNVAISDSLFTNF